MYVIRDNELLVSQLAQYLNKVFIGEDYLIMNVSKEQNLCDHSVFFIEDESKQIVNCIAKALLITTEQVYESIRNRFDVSYIISPNPRLDFYKIVNEFFITKKPNTISDSANISKTAEIGYNVNIGENALIGNNVKIGNNTYILSNAVIESNCIIGSNCIIKQGSLIGSDSFEFIDDDGIALNIPQFGSVIIKNNVLIGANTSIERPNFGETIIGDNVKIDDGVNIGQGSIIMQNTIISAGVVISTNVVIGENCVVGINTSIRDDIEIFSDVVIGMGSNVIHSIIEPGIYYGNPAKKH